MDVEVQESMHQRVEPEVVLKARDLTLSRGICQLEAELPRDGAEPDNGIMLDQQIDVSEAATPAMGAPVPFPLAVADSLILQGLRQLLQERGAALGRAHGV